MKCAPQTDSFQRVVSPESLALSEEGVAAQFIMKMAGCALYLAKGTVTLPEELCRCLLFERRHHYPQCADTQSEKSHL
jgi:hypothetical protein